MSERTLSARLRTAKRLLVVLYHLLPLFVAYARDRRRYLLFGGGRDVTPETRRRRARRVTDAFVALGPTFIKLGQVLSTRADALPREYTETLSELQDDVPPSDWSDARRVIEEDVGDVDEVFDDFVTDPVSGASLGQVYVAREDGRRLAVKVLRPGVERVVESDLMAMRALLPLVRLFTTERWGRTVEGLVDQFDDSVHREMEYLLEADTMRRARANFEGDEDVVVPEVVGRLSGDRVITMEYVESTKVDDAEALDRKGIDKGELVRRIQRAYAKMILEDGLFHADPHPGNLGVDDDGRLVFYDFGVAGTVSEGTRERLFDFYEAIGDEDTERMNEIFVELGLLPEDHDPDAVEEMFRVMVDDLKGRDIEETSAQNIITDIQDDMYGFPVEVTREFALLFRAITILEGVCQSLDEEFDFTYEAYIYVLRGEHGTVADAMEMVPDPVRERISSEDLLRIRRTLGPIAGFLRSLRGGEGPNDDAGRRETNAED